MAPSSHKTVSGSADQAEVSSGEILTPPLAYEQDPTVDEIILVRPENVETQARAAQDRDEPAPDRFRRKAQPRIVERPIDTIHVDSRYGSTLWRAGAFRRIVPRMNFLSEEGVRLVCGAIRIRVSIVDGKYFAFGGLLSYELACRSLSITRDIPVELYEEVSDRDVFDAALADQFILYALMRTNDEIDTSFLQMLVNAQKERPEIFVHGKTKLIESFERSPRDFRSKQSKKKPIREAEDAA